MQHTTKKKKSKFKNMNLCINKTFHRYSIIVHLFFSQIFNNNKKTHATLLNSNLSKFFRRETNLWWSDKWNISLSSRTWSACAITATHMTAGSFIHDHSLLLNETRHLRPVRYKLWFFHMERNRISSVSPILHDEGERRRQVREYLRMKPVSRNRLSREAQKKHADRGRNFISRGDNAFFRSR